MTYDDDTFRDIANFRKSITCIPSQDRTPDLYAKMVIINLKYLSSVPDDVKTYDFYMTLLRQGFPILYVSPELADQKMYNEAVKINGDNICFVPSEYQTKDIFTLAMQYGCNPVYIPDEFFPDIEVCKDLLRNHNWTLMDLPAEYKTKEMCLFAISLPDYGTPHKRFPICGAINHDMRASLRDIPASLLFDPDIWEALLKHNLNLFQYMPVELKNAKNCKQVLKKNALLLRYTPFEFQPVSLRVKYLLETLWGNIKNTVSVLFATPLLIAISAIVLVVIILFLAFIV